MIFSCMYFEYNNLGHKFKKLTGINILFIYLFYHSIFFSKVKVIFFIIFSETLPTSRIGLNKYTHDKTRDITKYNLS